MPVKMRPSAARAADATVWSVRRGGSEVGSVERVSVAVWISAWSSGGRFVFVLVDVDAGVWGMAGGMVEG